MQFALVNGVRTKAVPKLGGTCAACGAPMLAKCGAKTIWHWAHRGRRHCDPWWENETPWHRLWKSYFPEGWREGVHVDPSEERHVADVKTSSGVVLEFQNSPMPPEELQSREEFYRDMVWVVNGMPFADRFFVLGRLPSPSAPWVEDIVFDPQVAKWDGRTFSRISEKPSNSAWVLVHGMNEIQDRIDRDYVGHHHYDWVRPRSVWFEARSPVFVDFGGDVLWQFGHYGGRGLRCVQAVRKKAFIASYGGVYSETGMLGATAVRPPRNMGVVYKGENEVLLECIA